VGRLVVVRRVGPGGVVGRGVAGAGLSLGWLRPRHRLALRRTGLALCRLRAGKRGLPLTGVRARRHGLSLGRLRPRRRVARSGLRAGRSRLSRRWLRWTSCGWH